MKPGDMVRLTTWRDELLSEGLDRLHVWSTEADDIIGYLERHEMAIVLELSNGSLSLPPYKYAKILGPNGMVGWVTIEAIEVAD